MDLLTAFAYAVGGVICHQQPERSFFWDGQQLPVCARCAGLYLSGMGGAIAWLAIKLRARGRPIAWRADRALRTLLIASVPTALSVVSAAAAMWDGSNVARALMALPLGSAAGAIVAAVITKDLR